MGKSWKEAVPDHHNLYWANTGGIICIAILLDEDREIFHLWSSDKSLCQQSDWVASRHKPGWYFREEFADNLIFF